MATEPVDDIKDKGKVPWETHLLPDQRVPGLTENIPNKPVVCVKTILYDY